MKTCSIERSFVQDFTPESRAGPQLGSLAKEVTPLTHYALFPLLV